MVFDSYLEAGGPEVVWAELTNADGGVILGQMAIELNGESNTWQETFCLYPGCYEWAIQAEVPLDPENFEVTWSAFGSNQGVDVVFGDATVWYSFCVLPDAMEDCPESIDYAAVEGCVGTFEIGSFVEGESVVWDFGDGTEAMEGGHFAQHEFLANGVYPVTAWYTSSSCPDGVWLEAIVEVVGCSTEGCSIEVEVSPLECGLFVAHAYGVPEGATVEWVINGVAENPGVETVFDLPMPEEGVLCYEATATVLGGGCEAIAFTEFCVEPCGGGGSDCPESIEYAAMDGCLGTFEITSFVEGESVIWYFDDGTETLGGHFIQHEFPSSGWYGVTAWYTSSLCPEGVQLVDTVEVVGCGECVFESNANYLDCGIYQLNASGLPEGVVPAWYIDGEFVGSGMQILVDGLAPTEGVVCHAVTSYAQTETCWAGSSFELCTEPCGVECAIEIAASSEDGMWWTFVATGPEEGEALDWFIDGNFIETNETGQFQAGFDFNPYWEVCVSYASGPCEGQSEACYNNMEGDGCPNGLSVEALEGCAFMVSIGNGEPNAMASWIVDGNYLESTELDLTLEFPDGGAHTVVAYYVSSTCPGETYTATLDASACSETDCAVEVVVEELSEGVYLFTALAADGSIYTGPTAWWLGGATMEGNPVAYTWLDELPDLVEVCASFSPWEGCPESSELCTVMEPVAPGCEEVSFTISVDIADQVEGALPWWLVAEIAGVELGGVEMEGIWSWNLEGTLEFTLCLPPACFDLMLDWSSWLFNPELADLWSIEVLISELGTWEYAGVGEEEALLAFGMLEGCLPTGPTNSGAVNTDAQPLNAFPNPSSDQVNWSWSGANSPEFQIFNGFGKLMWVGKSSRIDASSWPQGVYFIQGTDANGRQRSGQFVVAH